MQAQLGAGIQSRFFRHNFKKPLELALAVYPDAKFVITHRDPAKVMASVASVETAVVRMYTG